MHYATKSENKECWLNRTEMISLALGLQLLVAGTAVTVGVVVVNCVLPNQASG